MTPSMTLRARRLEGVDLVNGYFVDESRSGAPPESSCIGTREIPEYSAKRTGSLVASASCAGTTTTAAPQRMLEASNVVWTFMNPTVGCWSPSSALINTRRNRRSVGRGCLM